MRKVTLKYDKRIKFSQKDIKLINLNVIQRIYLDGLNGFDQQTPHAKNKKSVPNLYRVLTDELRKGTKVTDDGNGTLTLSFDREDVIINSLDEMYGFTFLWSPSDIEYVDKICEAKAIALKLPLLSEIPDQMDLLTKTRETDSLEQRRALVDAMNKAKLDSTPQPLPQSIVDRVSESTISTRGKTMRFELDYNPVAKLSKFDLTTIGQVIKDRVRRNLTVNDSIISNDVKPFVDIATINSIVITKPRNGKLVMSVTYYTTELIELEKTKSQIFGWGFSDREYVNNLVNRKLNNLKNV